MDLSKLSDDDLQALAQGDVSKLSDDGLYILVGKEPPKKQQIPESDVAEGLGAGFLKRALGLSRTLGGDVAESQTKANEAAEYRAQANPMAVGLGGMAVDALAAAPGMVAAIPAGATGIAGMALEGLAGGLPAGLGRGGERYQELLDKGVDEQTAMKAALASGATGVTDFALPASLGGGLLKRVAGGAALNIGAGEADIATQNAILSDRQDLQQKQFDTNTMLVNGLGGAVFGAMGSKAPFERVPKEPRGKGDYLPDEVNEARDAPIVESARIARDNYKRTVSELERKLEQAKRFNNDPEKIAAIEEELAVNRHHFETSEQNLATLEAKYGKVEETVQPENHNQETDIPQYVYDELQHKSEVPLERTETPLESHQMDLPIEDTHVPVNEASMKFMEDRNTEFNSVNWDNVNPTIIDHEINRRLDYLDTKATSPRLREMIQSEIEHLRERQRGFNARQGEIEHSRLAPEIARHVENNDVKSALDVVATREQNPNLRIVADALRNNKDVTGKGKISFDFGQEHGAQHSNATQNVSFKTRGDANPISLIHEVLHRATATVIQRFKAGLLHNPVQKTAVKNISNLFESLRGDRYKALLNKYEALGGRKADLDIYLKNETELISYGTTDPRFAQALDQVRIATQSSFKNLANQIANMLGFDPKVRTAYRELLENTLQLAKHSDVPTAIREETNAIAGIKIDGDNIFQKTKSFASKTHLRLFTDQAPQQFRNNKALQELSQYITEGTHNTVKAINNILFGKVSGDGISIIRKMNDDSFAASALKLKANELHEVQGVLSDLYSKFSYLPNEKIEQAKVRFKQMADEAAKVLTPEQKAFFEHNYKAADELVKYTNDMFESMGIDYKVPYKVGYFLLNRSGKHGAMVTMNGTPLHFERFTTEADAQKFIKQVKTKYPELTVDLVHNKQDGLFESIQETLENALVRAQNTGENATELLQSMLNELTGTTKAIGGHLEHRTGITGYAGTEWFTSKERNAERYVNGLQNSVMEYVEQVRRRALVLKAAEISDKYSNMTSIERDQFNTYLNASVNSRSDISKIPEVDNLLREAAQNLFSPILGKADAPYLDTALRKMNAFMYFKTLGLVPQQWLAQFMSFTAGARELFNADMNWNGHQVKHNNNPLKAMASAGAGIRDYGKLLMKQYDALDPDLRAALKWAAEDTEVFRPHLAEAVMKQANLSDIGKTMTKVFNFLNAGNSFADSHSRVLAFTTYWHQFKDQGLPKQELAKLAAKLTDDNLMLMGEKHQPLIYGDAGILGKVISPLKTYAHGYAGNVLADVSHATDLNGMLRLSATALSAIMAGGIVSAPILADYDWLVEKAGMPEAKASKWAMENLPDFATYGMFSAMSKAVVDGGVDIGSSLRYRSIFDLLNIDSASFSITGKAIKSVYQLGKNALTSGVPDVTSRQAVMDLVPRGITAGLADDLLYNTDERTTVKKSGTNQALSNYGPADRVATYLGGNSIEESNVRLADRQRKLEEQDRTKLQQTAIELIQSESPDKQEEGFRLMTEKLGYNPFQVRKLVRSADKRSLTPEYLNSVFKNSAAGRRKNAAYGDMYNDR